MALFIYFYWIVRSSENLKTGGISSLQMANLFCGYQHNDNNGNADANNDSLFMLENA